MANVDSMETFAIAFTSDIVEIFRQILLDGFDADSQRNV